MSYRNVYGDLFLEDSHGVRSRFHVRQGTDDDVAVDEVWNENVYRLHPDHVKGLNVIDIGANAGSFSSWAIAAGALKVFAYEPESDNFTALEENSKDINVAVADFNGRGAVKSGQASGSGYLIKGDDFPVKTFRDVLWYCDSVALLKMDIEGSEYSCFNSIDSADLLRVNRIVMEFHGPGMVDGLGPEWNVEFGLMVKRLAEWGHVEILGRPSMGGMIYGLRY